MCHSSEVFCKTHWFMLPKTFRNEIWAAHHSRNREASLTAIKESWKWLDHHHNVKGIKQ